MICLPYRTNKLQMNYMRCYIYENYGIKRKIRMG